MQSYLHIPNTRVVTWRYTIMNFSVTSHEVPVPVWTWHCGSVIFLNTPFPPQLQNFEESVWSWPLTNRHTLSCLWSFVPNGKNPPTTVHVVEQTRQRVLNFSSFIAKKRLKYLEDIGQGQRSLHTTHPLILVTIYAKYGKNRSRTVCAVERTRQVTHFSSFIASLWLNDLDGIGQGKMSLCAAHPLMQMIICN